MPTVLVVYNAKDAKNADDYEQYLKSKKIPFLRSKPYINSFDMCQVRGALVSCGHPHFPQRFSEPSQHEAV